MTHVRITLIGKPGCHLCDDARAVVERVRGEVRERDGVETSLEELDILADAALARKHSEDIPVVLVNGRRHAIWRVDPERFASALAKAARRPRLGQG
ncbi:glutaredoxin family protein [Leucobacter allii]|uniref:Glutaredoxin family protein n=1 Tax=Leucobacter allii TaxID=2932247 RepID=A0ABY4FKM2_9MICO|nr:glutaredoxin family protein [Leucobacter allii]UOQ56666.1 glutaredoxin family protein [Leucobacter allii]